MNAAFDDPDEFGQTEALLRSAADYLEVSSDLRPRVVEAARAQVRQDTAARRRGLLLAAVIVFALLSGILHLSPTGSPLSTEFSKAEVDSQIFASSDDIWSVAKAAEGDAAWGIVEAFRQMREQQSQALREAF